MFIAFYLFNSSLVMDKFINGPFYKTSLTFWAPV